MRLTLLLAFSLAVALTQAAPVSEDKEKADVSIPNPTTVASLGESKEEVTEVPDEAVTTTQVPVESLREGRDVGEEEEDDEGDREDEEDDEEEDEDEEEEEEERQLAKAGTKPSLKKKAGAGKPVPVLREGVEDDEAEDLGIFEKDEPKSDEKASEEKSEEKEEDDEEDSNEDEERDDPVGSSGLVAEPVSSERGDVDEIPAIPTQNEVGEAQQPLAIAVVQPEETSDPVVPILVEDGVQESSKADKHVEKKIRKNSNAKKEDEDDEDDDDDDDEDEGARSVKVRARSAYSSPVLYYYPFPESPVQEDAVN